MVVDTGDFLYQTGEWGILNDTDEAWHQPLPETYFDPKVRDQHPPTTMDRYKHKGGHRDRERNTVQWCKHLTIRLAVLTFAVYYYFAVALVLKGADAASQLFQMDTALFCVTGVSFVAYCWQRNKKRHSAAHAVDTQHTVYVMNATSDDKGFITTHERSVTVSRA